MGLLSSLAGIAAPIVGGVFGGPVGSAIGGAVGGLLSGSSAPKSTTTTSQQQLDPRIQNIIFGDGTAGNTGLLAQYQALGQAPQSAASAGWANTNADYLNQYGGSDLNSIRNSAQGLMGGQVAPTSQAAQTQGAIVGTAQTSLPAYMVGNQVQAPSQNGIDLTGSYNSLLSGGNTDALMKSLQAGNDLTSAQFQKNQTDITNNLTRNVLPSIRGGAIAAGQYGSSRQGIAEGNALSDYTNQLTSANNQLSAANSANTANALAGAYESGQNRALSATQGLGAQQYGVASQNANTANAAEQLNVNNLYDATKTNAGLAQQSMLANQNSLNSAGMANAGFNQQTGLANQSAQLTNNAQNNSAAYTGSGLLGGLLSSTGNSVNAQDMYGINKAQQVNGLLAPYLGAGASQSTTSPLYQNQGNNILGGALAGGQLSSLFGGLTGGAGSSSLSNVGSSVAGYSPSTSMSIPSLSNLWA